MLVTRGYSTEFYVYRTDTWANIGTISDLEQPKITVVYFPQNLMKMGMNRNRLAKLGFCSYDFGKFHEGSRFTLHLIDGVSWKSTYTATSDYVGVWEYGRLQSTFDACESKHHIGSTTMVWIPL